MNIRLIERHDQKEVVDIMKEHPLQFPNFIIKQYPIRWSSLLRSSVENNKSRFYVAYNESDTIVGHAGYIFNSEENLYEIVGVAVKINCQRQGIGKALINMICNEVKKLNEKKIILYTLGHVGNEDTLTFYRNIGFNLINYENDFFQKDYHRVTFTKRLAY
ncbi:GNAT family N-acetyltransferase [Paenibacillus antarcticus]|uniref:GCN5 family acetyltransferase n=1 Tax=Paenibacillus antarcticus TaxID=253703 RepID=A0A162M910_9BACL|nr:GNAT family N-acetyltransferase [Paenibacillus antarcticus]OAB40293.1 GCN5 family acetyltransferase [Paenibacillus antarcticus]